MPPPATAVVGTPHAPLARRQRRRFYTVMSLVAVAVVIAGFGPSTVNTAARTAPLTLMVGLHAAIFTAWLLLFFIQTLLVGQGRIVLHRRLGYAGAVLAVVMVVSGYATAVAMARRGFDLSGDLDVAADPLGQLVFQLGDLVTFGVLVAAGLWYRRRPEAHKRLMLMATLGGLMLAPLAHLLSHFPAIRAIGGPVILVPLVMLLVCSAVYDRLSRGRIHPVSLWVPVAVFAWANLRAAVIGPSPAWRQFAAWLVG